MANLGSKAGIYFVRFRFDGREFKKSLKTRELAAAEAAQRIVEQTIYRLLVGLIDLPAGAEPGEFIVSGGKRAQRPRRDKTRESTQTIDRMIDEFLDAQKFRLADSTHALFTTHLSHWRKHLGNNKHRSCHQVGHRDLEKYLQCRIVAASETTASKERRTLLQLFRWAVHQGYCTTSPATALTSLKGDGDRAPFRTLAEIQALIDRGGLSDEESLELWECIYLSPDEIAGLLATVRANSTADESALLHAIPAYTGMRRGEVLRLRWSDVDLDASSVFARSRKQSRQRSEVIRQIDIHPELQQLLTDWRTKRPKGQFVVCTEGTCQPLPIDRANRLFWQPLRGTTWCLDSARKRFKIGFHTYRHSFASNLAALGIDQRIIDEWLGHSTEAMRRRYRHLFPSIRRQAIESFSLAAQTQPPRPGRRR